MDDSLMQYIATERSRGVVDADIKKALLEKGWDAGKVGAAFGENVLHATPVAFPKGFFVGRISRKEYLYSHLLLLAVGIVLVFSSASFMAGFLDAAMMGGINLATPSFILIILLLISFVTLVTLLSISLNVRRVHDLGHEWFWVLLSFIPIVTFFFTLYLFFFRGEQYANTYGPVPNNSRKIFDVLLGR